MATTSYLYHTLGLTSYHHERTEFRQGAVYYHVSKIGGDDASFLIWLVMDMPNKARQPTGTVLYPPFLNT